MPYLASLAFKEEVQPSSLNVIFLQGTKCLIIKSPKLYSL
jgi:hypothetical protein